jgi:hypothetical protein
MLSAIARRTASRAPAVKRFISTTPSRRSDALFVVRVPQCHALTQVLMNA